ncbi:hypothetical protein B5V01_00130 [Mesorhizobium erdmanii]|uniref:Uncharacterized protein n=2 Tax=Mesorhizobium TaxID=68287 RepID=A0A3M9X087_9HYPH|nr:hypothetical protein DNR46_33685 [Mesorhizobium japonicum]RXT53335.1 hypothetical protein B5V01_00130 [Mesorhizobium erdmanii]
MTAPWRAPVLSTLAEASPAVRTCLASATKASILLVRIRTTWRLEIDTPKSRSNPDPIYGRLTPVIK